MRPPFCAPERSCRKGPVFPLAFLFLSLAAFSGCGPPAPQRPLTEVDYEQARTLSDKAAEDLTRKDVKDLLNRLDLGFHTVVSGPGDLQNVMEQMYGLYGRPVTWVFKAAQEGIRTDGTLRRNSRSFFYAVKTTQYPMGKYFLKVEVVPAFSGGSLDISGFGFFALQDQPVPDYLK